MLAFAEQLQWENGCLRCNLTAYSRYRRKSAHKVRGQSGFSLFELLIVLILLAMLAGISAPAMGRFLDDLSFREQTAEILTELRYARLTAITTGQPVYLLLDQTIGSTLYFTGGVTKKTEFDLDEESSFILEPARITFYPAGQVTPALLSSVKGDRIHRFHINPLTALPVRE